MKIVWMIILVGMIVFLQPSFSADAAEGSPQMKPGSFKVEFTVDGKMNIAFSAAIAEDRIASLINRLGVKGMTVAQAESMFEENLRTSFEAQITEYRAYAGYPKHQAEMADIEEYKVTGSSEKGVYQLTYTMKLKSRQLMNILDPTFEYIQGKDSSDVSVMLHYPFPDIPLASGLSTIELGPDAVIYTITLPHPLINSRLELSDIPGFLSATAYNASFIVRQDDCIPVRLIGRVVADTIPEADDKISIEIRGDHSALVKADISFMKGDVTWACGHQGIEMVDAPEIITKQIEDILRAYITDELSPEISISMDESPDKLDFKISVEIPDLTRLIEMSGGFDYAVVGDWTYAGIPVANLFDQRGIPFFKETAMRSRAITYKVTMPGRISNTNRLRGSGLKFNVTGNTVEFYLEAGEYSFVTVVSDSKTL